MAKVSKDVPDDFLKNHLPDGEKMSRTEAFVRGGGTQKTHRGQQSHGHNGSGCNHESIPGVDKMTKAERDAYIERQAARTGADIESVED